MTSANGSGHVTLEGAVEQRNQTGIKLNGQWLNLSRFRPLELPDAGARVRAQVDPRGYLCEVEVVEPAPTQSPAVSRSETITRLAVLKAAAEFVGLWGQTREDIKSDHVLLIADKWLAWVNDGD